MIRGEEIKNARQKIGKTQEELSDVVNYSPRQISRFENDMNLERYDKFLEYLLTLKLIKPADDVKEGEE